ncbi:DEAD/DEAH box helicase [Rhodoblastus acidophilus]|uniref:DEAD/DEAH box helicase n=1 Tax=Candidatus Rhodoblastus alkanivorans TaxID=2954117 RepID=A0ABS9Z9F3_9HYPH|nr:DEAD/DEAH box helicase [Candidatus Rhodoblastus alkanivorans]MCI4679999.1 DEAD/DEAH box helicase [Candidatus Rhodoblastus alkanivorans]MCI4684259.1 DEAD/DEAH box helicase [Candidatus Rhodoblastus alkanivorans]MDI4641579.1 DEAD/DEAH box helicase [Rhodoblastus acidophilus]
MTFELASPALARALAEHGYVVLTPVQAAVLKPEAEGRDILVSAQTGSGKTVAFGLAMASDLIGAGDKVPDVGAPLGLVIAPTRELALQVAQELRWLYSQAGARIVACVGGMDPRSERRALEAGAAVVVGTPGRLRDHLERGALDLSRLAAVALDEADEMLDMGFREDLEFILDATPETRRTLLFSATMPKSIVALAKKYQRNALRIEATGGETGHADIEYRAVRVDPREAEKAVINLLRFFDSPTAIVFCNTRDSSRHLQAMLQERGFTAALLSGELGQHERNLSIQALRDGRARVCVATDVAARGLDLPTVGLVIHADLPHDAEALQHRSGRTGRAGRKGVSVLLVPPKARRRAENLFAEAKVVPDWQAPPTADEIRKLDRERMTRDEAFSGEPSEEESEIAAALLGELGAEKCAQALARLLRARLPEAEEVADPGHAPDFASGKAPRGGRQPLAGGVWFRLDVGRDRNADPKWLLPMLCRKGGVTRADIGAIRIFPKDSKVEIAAAAAEAFLHNMRRPGGDPIRVERIGPSGDNAGPKERQPRKGEKKR